jgi:ribosome-binding factor A
MAGGRRTGQVGDLVRAELASLIQRELRDPKVGFVTITGVKLSPDLRHARVFVSVLDEKQEEESVAGLQRAAGFLRRELASRLQLKNVPALVFEADPSLRQGARIEELLSSTPDDDLQEDE